MPRINRFYLPPEQWSDPFVLSGSEAHHLTTVLRTPPGSTISLFDGQGQEGMFEITSCTKKQVELKKQTICLHEKPPTRIWLAPGWNRATRRGWFLEKAVELGAWGILFWQSDFSQGRVPHDSKDAWTGQCLAAAKQCANPWLPEIHTYPGGIRELIKTTQSFDRVLFLWEGEDSSALLSPEHLRTPGDTLVILGPEGGFSRHEVMTIQEAGSTPLSLGNRILRWETAALLCLGIAFWDAQCAPHTSL
jgi:16S rRNA (uracil1498-N3)-methyltransferase